MSALHDLERYCIIRVHHIKHAVPGKRVLNVLFLVTMTLNQADALKLTGLLVHMVLAL